MTKTQNTATAAQAAKVTPQTIRTWCRNGRVSATKVAGKWAINADSLTAHLNRRDEIATTRITRNAQRILAFADFSAYVEKGRAAARIKVLQLLEDNALVPTSRAGQYSAAGSEGARYLVDTHTAECDCPSGLNRGYCTHRTTADAIEASKGNVRPALALVAA